MGPPCAGKTTLGQRLATEFRVPHIIASDLFQASGLSDASTLGRDHRTSSGRIIAPSDSSDLVALKRLKAVITRVQQQDCHRGFILDNFPRSLEQAEGLDQALRGQSWPVSPSEGWPISGWYAHDGLPFVLDLEVPVQVLEERGKARRVDAVTGLPHLQEEDADEDDDDGIADETKSLLLLAEGREMKREERRRRRADDLPARFQGRVQRYASNMLTLRRFYGDRCRTVDASRAAAEVLTLAHAALAALAKSRVKRAPSGNLKMDLAEPHLVSVLGRDLEGEVRGWMSSSDSGESPARQADRLLKQVFLRLDAFEELVYSYSQSIHSTSNWTSHIEAKECGCSTRSIRFAGPSAPTAQLPEEVEAVLNESERKIWTAKEGVLSREHADTWYWPWCSPCLVACSPGTQVIADLQRELATSRRRASSLRYRLTSLNLKTTSRVEASTLCAACAAVVIPEPASP